PLAERGDNGLTSGGGERMEKADHWDSFRLRARDGQPKSGCAAKKCDELAPVHSITSSARASSDCGTVRPSAFAVLRLITNSNLVGCSTGRLAGFVPARILLA